MVTLDNRKPGKETIASFFILFSSRDSSRLVIGCSILVGSDYFVKSAILVSSIKKLESITIKIVLKKVHFKSSSLLFLSGYLTNLICKQIGLKYGTEVDNKC